MDIALLILGFLLMLVGILGSFLRGFQIWQREGLKPSTNTICFFIDFSSRPKSI